MSTQQYANKNIWDFPCAQPPIWSQNLHVEVVSAGVSLQLLRKAIHQRMKRMERLKEEPWRDAVHDCVIMWEQARVKGL